MIFTIGTSDRTAEQFFGELDRRGVWLMVDVRSRPYSRNAWASRRALEIEATRHGIVYAWSGAILGGLNAISTTSRDFEVAADTLLDATECGPVAIFCAEGDPARCHRSWKVGAHLLARHGFSAVNVLRSGGEEDIAATLARTRSADIPRCLADAVTSLLAGQGSLF